MAILNAHDWDDGVLISEATCTENGLMHFTCLDCGLTRDRQIPALGHEKGAATEQQPATCTEDGFTEHTCSRCGDSYTDAITPALGHALGDWQTETAASCTEDGLRRRECSRCEYAEWERIPAYFCFSADYIDTPDTENWAHAGIDFCIGRGIMGSTATDRLTFEPGSTTTRAMIVSVLYRLSGSPEIAYSTVFPDIPNGKWYTNAVLWAQQNGVVVGYQDGSFGANDLVTREQMAVILKGYTQNVLGKPAEERTELTAFADADKVTWSRTPCSGQSLSV